MKKWLTLTAVTALIVCLMPAISAARGTRYFINWPKDYIGPVYVQVYDIRVTPPYSLIERSKVWVTWGDKTKCYEIGNWGTYTLKFYKYDRSPCPMIISGPMACFRIRYSMAPPWI